MTANFSDETKRSTSDQARRELTEMVNAWDPAGLMQLGAPVDEYDCVVDDVLRALSRGDSPTTLVNHLATKLPDHFGVRVADPAPFVEQAVAWYRSRHAVGTGDE